jgi:hypothetical protein
MGTQLEMHKMSLILIPTLLNPLLDGLSQTSLKEQVEEEE